jgi:predicted thioesterase
VKAALKEVNGRRLIFSVEAYNEDGVKIGDGIHERSVIDVRRFVGRSGGGA